MWGVRFAGVLVLLVTASVITISAARTKVAKPKCDQQHRNWNSSSGSGSSSSSSWSYSSSCGNGSQAPPQPRPGPRKIVVKWSEEFNFEQWASTNQPIYENDILVFQYDREYNVYLMMNMQDMFSCDFSEAKLIGNSNAGNGFEYVLKKPKTWDSSYYFACDGYCDKGMQFSVFVLPKYR